MERKPLDVRLQNMGADFNTREILNFLNCTDGSVFRNRVHTARGDYLTAETEDGMQIWFQVDAEDENCISSCDVHFKSPVRTKLRLDGWTDQKDDGLFGLAYMWNEAGDADFPLNIDIVDAGLFADYEGGEFTAQVAAFGHHIGLFPDPDAFRAANPGFAPESCIPMGTFPLDDDDEWEPSADAIMTGTIRGVRRSTNSYTGGVYYHLVVDCIGMQFDALLREEDVPSEPVVGGTIQGTFYLTARLFPSRGDACLTPLFSLNTKDLVDDFPSMRFREEVADEPDDGWELIATPVMPDKGILLIFQNATRAEAGKREVSPYYYRFLRYDEGGTLVELRRTRLNGRTVTTAYYDNMNHLHIVFCFDQGEWNYIYDLDDGQDPHPVYELGRDVSRLITDSDGNIFVGRDFSYSSKSSGELVSVFPASGEKKAAFFGDNYRCAELLLDEKECVWYLAEPNLSLNKIVSNEDGWICADKGGFPLEHVLSMALSDDGSRMFCECDAIEGESRFYILTRERGQYGVPEILCPPLLIQEDCEVYGQCATAKDRIVFRADDNLFFFRLEPARRGTPSPSSKPQRTEKSTI